MFKKYIIAAVLLLIAVITFLFYKSQELRRVYNEEAAKIADNTSGSGSDILTEADIKHLPEPVQKYLTYVGAVGKEKVRNFRVVFEGEFRTDPGKDWAPMRAEQYSDLKDTKRLYYMEMKMAGLPVVGLHKYEAAKATMLVKVAGLFKVVDGRGDVMDKGETVTVFNDMCILAPASLIDERIQWESIDPLTVKATFDNKGISVSAVLHFNDRGELLRFVSDDRYYSPTGKTYESIRWSTVLTSDYKYEDYNGIRLSSGGEAVWSFPEGDYAYGRIGIKEIEYNVKNQE